MSLAKFIASLGGKGGKLGEKIGGGIANARAAGGAGANLARKYPKTAVGGAAAAGGAGLGLAELLGDDEMELEDIDSLEDAGDYGSQSLRKIIAKLGLEL